MRRAFIAALALCGLGVAVVRAATPPPPVTPPPVTPPPVLGPVCAGQADCPSGLVCQHNLCQPLPALGDGVPLFHLGVPPVIAPQGGADVALAEQATALLRRALAMGGAFVVVPASDRPANSFPDVPTMSGLDAAAWYGSGVSVVLVSALWSSEGGAVVFEVAAIETETGQRVTLPRPRLSLPANDLLAGAEAITSDLLEAYSGRPALFDTRIACTRKPPGEDKQIVMVDLVGARVTAVSQAPSLHLLPRWSPDGRVAYTSYADGNPDLWFDGRKLSGFDGLNMGASFAPDGETLVLTLSMDGNPEIYLMRRADGAVLQRLTHHPAIDTSPTFSPDGTRIAFVSDRTGVPQIYLMTLATGDVHPLTTEGYCTNPAWSPHGDVIAFDRLMGGDRSNLFVVSVATGVVRRLTNCRCSDEHPSFSPDGRQIVFASTRAGSQQLFVMTAEGANIRQLTHGPDSFGSPSWSPRRPHAAQP